MNIQSRRSGTATPRLGFDMAPLIGHVTEAFSNARDMISGFQDYSKNIIEMSLSSRKSNTIPASFEESVSGRTREGQPGGKRSRAVLRSGKRGIDKEQIGRATWTLLHTIAAQYPDHPSSRQKRDAKNLIDIMTRMYPCGECAEHFSEVVKAYPPQVGSRQEFSQWMCRIHNVVNRSIGKAEFNCSYVSSRWEGIECDTPRACSLRYS